MPHLSRNPLSPHAEKELVKALELILTKLTKEEDMNVFLLALLSSTEQLMLAKRLAMVILLKEGVPESEVAQSLHVTRGTVTRMQLFVEARGRGYEIGLRVLENDKIMKEVKGILLKFAAYSARAAGGRI
jgi:Trp operon repressor